MPFVLLARNTVRGALLVKDGLTDPRLRRWPAAVGPSDLGYLRVCNICGWHGPSFSGTAHSESLRCTVCGSVARDRFLYYCWTKRSPYRGAAAVLETSPRLGEDYRNRMRELVDYRCSDYDQQSHRADLALDLQAIDLPDESLDVVLTPHVLEHVPDSGRALSELLRVLRPGGRMYLQVPLPQGKTAPPTTPEYHGDNTLVYWRFGWDLVDQIRDAGFRCFVLTTYELVERLLAGQRDWAYDGADVDAGDVMGSADVDSLTPIAPRRDSRRYGFEPAFMFVTWECIKPG